VHYHASLLKRECHEGANGKQRDQTIGHAFEHNQQEAGKKGQRIDTKREDQPPSPDRKRIGSIPFFRDRPAQTRKIRKLFAESTSTARIETIVTKQNKPPPPPP
jgi:hypothetical protein